MRASWRRQASRESLSGATPAATATRPRLVAIFLVMLVVLSMIGAVPAIARKVMVRSDETRARKAIVRGHAVSSARGHGRPAAAAGYQHFG